MITRIYRIFLLTCFVFVSTQAIGQQKGQVSITGTIGSYAVEMEILEVGWEDGSITGRYRYAGKEKYLTLKGTVLGNCIQLTEYYKDQATGDFYLTIGEENIIFGKWVGGSKSFDVSLKIASDHLDWFNTKSPEDYANCVSNGISGTYVNEFWFLNDWMFREESPQIECGYNGGYLMVEDTGDDSIYFKVQVVCGPTYHLAFAEGKCRLKGNKATYVMPFEPYEDGEKGEDCVISFEFGEKSAYASATGSMTCGFGARASLDHSFTKVGDAVDFASEEPLLEELFCRD